MPNLFKMVQDIFLILLPLLKEIFSFQEHENNKLLQIKRIFSRIDLFLKKECAGGT